MFESSRDVTSASVELRVSKEEEEEGREGRKGEKIERDRGVSS